MGNAPDYKNGPKVLNGQWFKDTDIKVFPGMHMKGIANAKWIYQPPATVNIEGTKPCDQPWEANLEAEELGSND